MTDEDLIAAAREAAARSYSPYSAFPVGAALGFADGSVVTGTASDTGSGVAQVAVDFRKLRADDTCGGVQFSGVYGINTLNNLTSGVIEAYGVSAMFATVSDLLRRIKETYRRDAETTEREVIESFVGCDLLVVDELGVQVGSDHEKLLLFEVLNGRYQELRPTILISNLSADDLEAFLGHRVMDRYRECGVVLAFDWGSYRGRKAA